LRFPLDDQCPLARAFPFVPHQKLAKPKANALPGASRACKRKVSKILLVQHFLLG
jgi:hypothetical protein